MEVFIKSAELDVLEERLRKIRCVRNNVDLRYYLRRNHAMQKAERASALLLGALISTEVMLRVFDNPFHAFVGEDGVTGFLEEARGNALLDLTRLFAKSKSALFCRRG